MEKIFLKRREKIVRRLFKTDAVIGTGVIDENVEPIEDAKSFHHAMLAIRRTREITRNKTGRNAGVSQLSLQLSPGLFILVHEGDACAFAGKQSNRRGADACGAARNER